MNTYNIYINGEMRYNKVDETFLMFLLDLACEPDFQCYSLRVIKLN